MSKRKNLLEVGWGHMDESELYRCIVDRYVTCEEWFQQYPELLIHPRDTIDPASLGMHQDWTTNLLPFREIEFHGRTIYLFRYHIEDLLMCDEE